MSLSVEDTAFLPSISVSPTILIVDADEAACAALKCEVELAGYAAITASAGEAALQSLHSSFTPLIIMDRRLPGMDGLELCRRIRAQQFSGYIYIIVRTIDDKEVEIIEGFEAGADDCFSKATSIAQLLARLKTARRILAQEQALKHMLAERRKMSLTDVLTGAYNRRYFMKYGDRAVRGAQVEITELSLLALDIDHFKSINDRHGHSVGDAVLVEFVRRIRGLLRKNEWCARMGGEEFAIVLPQSDLKRARRVAERIRQASFASKFLAAGTEIALTVSIGGSGFEGFEQRGKVDLTALLRQADECLYRSKRAGRNMVTMASPITPT